MSRQHFGLKNVAIHSFFVLYDPTRRRTVCYCVSDIHTEVTVAAVIFGVSLSGRLHAQHTVLNRRRKYYIQEQCTQFFLQGILCSIVYVTTL